MGTNRFDRGFANKSSYLSLIHQSDWADVRGGKKNCVCDPGVTSDGGVSRVSDG